jgi:hypothetical protein
MKSQPSKRAGKDKKQGKEASDNPTLVKWNEMNRKQRREIMRQRQSENLSLEVVHPHAAGIDIGNESHYVAVPPSRDPQPVRCFGCTTAELKKMAEWLTQCGFARWRCNLGESIGSRSTTFWKGRVWKCIW